MKIFRIKYQHVWTGWQYCYVAAESFDEAKKKVKQLVENYWDVAEYMKLEWCVENYEEGDICNVLKRLREVLPKDKMNEFFIKDVIE